MPADKIQTWEYCTLQLAEGEHHETIAKLILPSGRTLSMGECPDDETWVSMLNRLGAEGWELAAAEIYENFPNVFTFKRILEIELE